MVTLNPIILDELKTYIDENHDIPQEMHELVKKLLEYATHESINKDGIDKIYDQMLEKFISNSALIEWSKNYGS